MEAVIPLLELRPFLFHRIDWEVPPRLRLPASGRKKIPAGGGTSAGVKGLSGIVSGITRTLNKQSNYPSP
jgi:hypothetical protein